MHWIKSERVARVGVVALTAAACTMPNPKFGATGDESASETGAETGTGDGTDDGTETGTDTSTTDTDPTDTGTETTGNAECGDGMVEGNELCDGNDVPNATCEQCQILCHEGFDNCNQKPGDGCEVDLLSAAASCGYCGHDCEGGDCKAGVCLAVLVADAQGSPYDLAVDPTDVYWVNRTGGTVMHVDKAGLEKVQVIAEGQNGPTGIAVRGGTVYWTNFYAGTIMRAALGDVPAPFAKGQAGPFAIALDDMAAYWTNFDGGTVAMQPLNAMVATTLAYQQGQPRAIDVTADQVVWTTSLAEGSVQAVSKGGNQVGALATGLGGEMGGLDADLEWVYFTAPVPGLVAKVPTDGGEITKLAVGEPKPKDVVFDGKYFYWTNSDSGEVVVQLRAGGEPWTLANSPGTPWAIAQDDAVVYWTDLTDGSVWKVAKP